MKMHWPRGFSLRELADRLEERQAFDVADRAADLAEHEVGLVLADADEVLDLVGDVRDHLDRAAEIVAAALLLEHVRVDAARRDRVGAAGGDAGEALVMAEVEVGLRAVVGDEDLAMFEGRHRAWIDVEVGVELSQADRVAAGLEEGAECGRGEAFAEARNDPASDEDKSCHALLRCRDRGLPGRGFTGLNL
jgi:hypothetical protein